MRTDPHSAYSTCISIRLHFDRGKYDAFKFNFKGPNRSRKAFDNSRDKFVYEKIARKYPRKVDLIEFMVANVLVGNTWIRDMNDDIYDEWLGRVQSMTYRFRNEVKKLTEATSSFNDLLLPCDGEVPIMTLLRRGEIQIETVVIIDALVDFLSNINTLSVPDPLNLLGDLVYKVEQYKPFILHRINKNAMKKILIELFT